MSTSIAFQHLLDHAAIKSAFDVMRELRPHLLDADAFAAQIKQQHDQGYRLLAACDEDGIVGLAGYRVQSNLLYGCFIYIDDLVVSGRRHRAGLGRQMLDAVRQVARDAGCAYLVLDTGLHNALAQRFYFRNGLLARGMHFVESLTTFTEAC